GKDHRARDPRGSEHEKTGAREIAPRRRPVRLYARRPPDDQLRAREAHPLVPPAATHADGPRPDRDPPARADDDEPAGDRLSRPGVRRDDGGAEKPAALRLPDQESA